MSGIGTITDIVNNIPVIFYEEGEHLWNLLSKLVLLSKKVKGKGASANWTVSNGGSNVQVRAPGYTVTPSSDVTNTDRVKLTLNRGIYSTSLGFTDSEIAIVQSYVGTPDVADIVKDLWADEFQTKMAQLIRQLELDAMVGTGTSGGNPNLVGLLNVLATSGTYAGATFNSTTTNPGLSATVQSSVGNVSRADIRQMIANIKSKSGFNPDYLMCSPLTATYLAGIADAQIRYMTPGNLDLMQTRAMDPLDGWNDSKFSVLGIPVVENTAWGVGNSITNPSANADGYIVFGARDKVVFDVLPYTPAQDAFLSDIHQGVSRADNSVVQPVGMPIRGWAYAKTSASIICNMDIEVAMCVTAPNRFGLMTGVTGFSAS